MLKYIGKIKFAGIMPLLMLVLHAPAPGQSDFLKPEWCFGAAAGLNLNYFSSDIRSPNSAVRLQSAFTGGSGVRLYFAPLIQYLPDRRWGGMLQLGIDGRGGSFGDIDSAGNKYTLSSSMNYVSLEPSVRISPFNADLYFYAGPRIGFNVAKTFKFGSPGNPEQKADWDAVRSMVLTGQAGVGYDITISNPDARWHTVLSPYLSFHFGQGPRSAKDWGLTSLRLGLAAVFGSRTELQKRIEKEIQFSVQAPAVIPGERKIKETFPMRNYIFFDERNNDIPGRYVKLTPEDAGRFKEEQLLMPEPKDLTGRSKRQMTVYHNIINIIGDRMRNSPAYLLQLHGSSESGVSDGRALAEAVKRYLVRVFGIAENRISTDGSEKPPIPSAIPGGTRELEMVRPEDRRVEISGSSPELLEPVRIVSIQTDPLDSDLLFNVPAAGELLSSWSVEVSEDDGPARRFGPFTSDRERIPGKMLLGEKLSGNYRIAMLGDSRAGNLVRKEETVRLTRSDQPEADYGLRFSILFEFDQSKTVATYERFLTGTVAPLIPDGGSVIIHGHTDMVGEESHNLGLSRDRALETMNILERELAKSHKKRVKFDTYGFGEDVRRAPFDNALPEERFYNRTVIIDIVPE